MPETGPGKKEEEDIRRRQSFQTVWQVSSVGFTLVACVFAGYFFGSWLDRHFHSWPWLTLVFLFIGIAAGFLNVYRTIRKYID